jgi:hypothetical protein
MAVISNEINRLCFIKTLLERENVSSWYAPFPFTMDDFPPVKRRLNLGNEYNKIMNN